MGANSNANPLMLLVCSVNTPIHAHRFHLLCVALRCASCVDEAFPLSPRILGGRSHTPPSFSTDIQPCFQMEDKRLEAARRRIQVPPGKWRIGVAHRKATVLFFRFANKGEVSHKYNNAHITYPNRCHTAKQKPFTFSPSNH